MKSVHYSIVQLQDDGSNWKEFEMGVHNYLFETGAHFFIDEIKLPDPPPSLPSGVSYTPSPQLAEQIAQSVQGVKTRSRTAADLAAELLAAGSDPGADPGDDSPPVVSAEKRIEACYRCRGFLRRHLPPWLVDLAGTDVTFVDAFCAVRDALFEATLVQAVDLLRDWGSLRQFPAEPVSTYFTRVSALRSRLVLAGQPMGEKATLVQLTAGLLPPLLSVARSHLDSREDATLASLKIRLLTHEQDMARSASVPAPVPGFGMVTRGQSGGVPVCDRCGVRGHVARDCPAPAPVFSSPGGVFGAPPLNPTPFTPPARRFTHPAPRPPRRGPPPQGSAVVHVAPLSLQAGPPYVQVPLSPAGGQGCCGGVPRF